MTILEISRILGRVQDVNNCFSKIKEKKSKKKENTNSINLLRSQAEPVNGGKHLHCPVARLHWPLLLHSATAWALFVPVGMSANALPAGQVPAKMQKRGVL